MAYCLFCYGCVYFNCEGSNKGTSIFRNSLNNYNLITYHMLVTQVYSILYSLLHAPMQVRCVTQLVVWLDSGGDYVLTLPNLQLADTPTSIN